MDKQFNPPVALLAVGKIAVWSKETVCVNFIVDVETVTQAICVDQRIQDG